MDSVLNNLPWLMCYQTKPINLFIELGGCSKAVCISNSDNNLWKGMNSTTPFLTMDKELCRLATSLGEGKA